MNASTFESSPAPKKPGFFQRSAFFWLSVGAHAVLIAIATALVVQNVVLKKKVPFEAAAQSPQVSMRALEYKVSAPQSGGSSPMLAKRITAKSASKITLPEMPALPDVSEVLPVAMPGLGGAGIGSGLGSGTGSGTGGSGHGLGTGETLFGFRERSGGSLVGTFYDLKQTPDRQPTGMDPGKYGEILADFIMHGFRGKVLEKFYRAPEPLYATQVFTPTMGAESGPAAFGVANEVQPTMWVVHYKGRVSPPETGTYYFVGAGDDIMAVKLRGRVVMQNCWLILGSYQYPKGQGTKYYPSPLKPNGFARGFPMALRAGEYYDIEIIIGEQPGTGFFAELLFEKSGVDYPMDASGAPRLPIFRVADSPPPEGNTYPYLPDGPIWKAERLPPGPAAP